MLRALIILDYDLKTAPPILFGRSRLTTSAFFHPELNFSIPLPNGMKLLAHRPLFESCAHRTCDRSKLVVPKIAEAQECLFMATVSLGMHCICKK